MEKQYVRALFNSIAFRYDLLNHLLSGGADLYWRRRAVEHMRKLQPRRILDVATGTADLAIAALRLGPLEVIGVDIAEEMLKLGREKLEKRGLPAFSASSVFWCLLSAASALGGITVRVTPHQHN